MKNIVKSVYLSIALTGSLLSATSLRADELFQVYARESAGFRSELSTRGAAFVKDKVAQLNQAELAKLRGQILNRFPRRIEFVSSALANSIYRAVVANPVASLDKYSTYDPTDQGIGFCFGRAMTVHLEGIYQGVSNDSIRKLWALGSLKTGNTSWRYHVTSILKSRSGVWYAIDPIMGRVMTVDQWYAEVKTFDTNNQMRVYITEAEKFGPSSRKYHNSELLDPYYNSYFVDLIAYFRNLYEQIGSGS
jgi:hypothetical protein